MGSCFFLTNFSLCSVYVFDSGVFAMQQALRFGVFQDSTLETVELTLKSLVQEGAM